MMINSLTSVFTLACVSDAWWAGVNSWMLLVQVLNHCWRAVAVHEFCFAVDTLHFVVFFFKCEMIPNFGHSQSILWHFFGSLPSQQLDSECSGVFAIIVRVENDPWANQATWCGWSFSPLCKILYQRTNSTDLTHAKSLYLQMLGNNTA